MLTICLYKMQCGKPTRGPDISLLDGRRLDAHDATDRTGPGAAGGPGRERTDRTVVCTCASCGHDRAGVPGIRLRDTAAGRLRPPFGIRRRRARPRTLHAFAIESAIGAPRTPLLPALRPECPRQSSLQRSSLIMHNDHPDRQAVGRTSFARPHMPSRAETATRFGDVWRWSLESSSVGEVDLAGVELAVAVLVQPAELARDRV